MVAAEPESEGVATKMTCTIKAVFTVYSSSTTPNMVKWYWKKLEMEVVLLEDYRTCVSY